MTEFHTVKRIDNSRIVRHVEPVKMRRLFRTVALGGVAWYAATVPLTDRLARIGIAGVLGGAVGNLVDRATAGYVLDFVDAYFGDWHFWAFNVADAAITVGVIFMILDILGVVKRFKGQPSINASNPV